MTIKAGQPLVSLARPDAREVLKHPAQQAMVGTVEKFITRLRLLETPADCYQFQGYLFAHLHKIEERRGKCSRVAKRLRQGKRLPADAPLPPPTGDPAKLATWEREVYVYERLARQLRTVGDGFAWTCFHYDRRMILALARNDSPGPIYPKKGLPYELGAIQELWKTKGHFALHHDLTNCLRIADLTEFTADGQRLLHEIKAKAHVKKNQLEQARAVVDALNNGGRLPGSTGDHRLIQLQEPYVTNLKALNDLLQLAKANGHHGIQLPQGRAVMASSLFAMAVRWRDNPEEGAHFRDSTRHQALKSAGIDKAIPLIRGYSGDSASRSPIMAPWVIYPFSPNDIAALICDTLVFDTTVSPEALVESLERAGLRGEVLVTAADTRMKGTTPVIRVHWRDRTITLHALGLGPLLYELVEPDTLARGMREVFLMDDRVGYPEVVYANEAANWSLLRPGRGRWCDSEPISLVEPLASRCFRVESRTNCNAMLPQTSSMSQSSSASPFNPSECAGRANK